jgi:hypothetical protein
MKLTKAQRLFVAIGHEDKAIIRYAEWEKRASSSRGKIRPSHCRSLLKQTRARRKRLIREALEAYETEKIVQQAGAYERGFCAGLRINNTTKTQHT